MVLAAVAAKAEDEDRLVMNGHSQI